MFDHQMPANPSLKITREEDLLHAPVRHGVISASFSIEMFPTLSFKGDFRGNGKYMGRLKRSLMKHGHQNTMGPICVRVLGDGRLSVLNGGRRIAILRDIASSRLLRALSPKLKWVPMRIYVDRESWGMGPEQIRPRGFPSRPVVMSRAQMSS